MNKSNVKLNYIYNLAYQIFALIVPLITTPYVARTLGTGKVGQFSFAASVNSFFCMFAALGFSFYAQREIAKNQSDRKRQSVVFWEIMVCKLITGIVVFACCWMLIFFGAFSEYALLLKILSIEILGTTLNIAFFFQGNERFGLVALRDFLIRIFSVLVVFLFVKKPDDLWLYALCTAGSSLISSVSLWPCLNTKIDFIKISELNPWKHFIPSVKLFVPTIAISIYTLLDKPLIGVLIPGDVTTYLPNGEIITEKLSDIENGYYAQAEKIIKMGMMVLASLGTVMMPRNAKELAEGNEKNFLNNVNKAISFVFFIGAPIAAGLFAIASNFSPWFFGIGYEKVPSLMRIFCFMILPAGLGNVLGQQYLLPKGEDNKYIIVYVSCAIINLVLNLLMIPQMFSYGAAVATVIAETCAPIIMLYMLRGSLSVREIMKTNWKTLVAAGVMLLCVFGTANLFSPSIIHTGILIAEGIIVYVLGSIALKNQLVEEALMRVRSKMSKNSK